ncbi:hypothetical protein KIPB_009171 [Kipferlia bialata]|uniref:Uncharacterized protein n=1 Tax=Kipferlia bialata TaxID=797122 RepID=A0A9K3D1V9_9EUKA|nr:hypothetical protein KIPB_009171 [Kipferlia bialata]|eukprot:g9171.t1
MKLDAPAAVARRLYDMLVMAQQRDETDKALLALNGLRLLTVAKPSELLPVLSDIVAYLGCILETEGAEVQGAVLAEPAHTHIPTNTEAETTKALRVLRIRLMWALTRGDVIRVFLSLLQQSFANEVTDESLSEESGNSLIAVAQALISTVPQIARQHFGAEFEHTLARLALSTRTRAAAISTLDRLALSTRTRAAAISTLDRLALSTRTRAAAISTLDRLCTERTKSVATLHQTGVFELLLDALLRGEDVDLCTGFLTKYQGAQRVERDGVLSPASPYLMHTLPQPLISLLETDGTDAFAERLTAPITSPELCWDESCRDLLQTSVRSHVSAFREELAEHPDTRYGDWCMTVYGKCPALSIVYPSLSSKLCIGGVYVELFLEEPATALKHPDKYVYF